MALFEKGVRFLQRKKPFEPDNLLFKFLENGGSPEMNVNGAAGVNFDYVVPADKYGVITRLNFLIKDTTILPDGFGGLATLTNGLKIQCVDTNGTTILKEFYNSLTIKEHMDFSLLAGIDVAVKQGSGSDSLGIRWTIERTGERLFLLPGQIFRVKLQDDLTGLQKFRTMIQGVELDL